MCQFISLFHNPLNGDIAVADLNSHSKTEKQLKLNKAIWREGHCRPDGSVELRVEPNDRQTQRECTGCGEELTKEQEKHNEKMTAKSGNRELCMCDNCGQSIVIMH